MKKPALLLLLLTLFCRPAGAVDSPLNVFVSIPPQKYFVKAIAGELAEVAIMVRPGASPHDYEPSPSQMTALARTKIYFAVGVPFEDVWLERFSSVNPDLKIVHTEAGIEKKPISRHGEFSTHEQDGEDHHHGILDPHVWLSPPLVEIQAKNIKDSLITADPEHRASYETNYAAFISELKDLDARVRTELQNTANRSFLVFHPSWGYFADAYGLKEVAIEYGGKDPRGRHLAAIVKKARELEITAVFVQPQFSSRFAAVVAEEINGKLVEADPLAENWRENLLSVASKMKSALR